MMQKFKYWLQRLFAGCYGTDQLNIALLGAEMVLCIVNMFLRSLILEVLILLSWGLVLFRMLSKNRYARVMENRRFLQFVERIRDRQNRYFKCPKCRQWVRVPRHKGKVAITCPRCSEKFIRKTGSPK